MSVEARHDERALHEQPVGPAALRTFFRIAEAWGLSAEEQRAVLGVPASSTYYKWKKSPPPKLSPDTLERLSYVFGIYKALQILIPEPGLADRWVRSPNGHPIFGGAAPLQRLTTGRMADLYLVRRHLDGERGG